MSLVIESGSVNYTSQTEMQGLLDRLRETYPNLQVGEYDEIAKDQVNLSGEIERYVRAWFVEFFYPDYYAAYYGDVDSPEASAKIQEIDTNFYALIADNPALLADESIVPMPYELRKAFVAELNAATGGNYSVSGSSSAKSSSSQSDSQTQTGAGDTVNPEIFNGFTNAEDIDRVTRYFPSNSLPGQLFGFLGENALLARNVQAKATLGLAEISRMEEEIMADLTSMEKSGLRPDDPAYHTEMQKIQLRIGDLNSSKEEYMSLITNSQQKIQQLVELLSSFVKSLNESERQLASNFRVA